MSKFFQFLTIKLLQGLSCGKAYEFYIVGAIEFTMGRASGTVSVRLPGKLPGPSPPSQAIFLEVNSTYLAIDISQWPSGGCSIYSFDAEYRIEGEPWKMCKFVKLSYKKHNYKLKVRICVVIPKYLILFLASFMNLLKFNLSVFIRE